MAVSATFRSLVEEQLGRIVPVETRAMFGGVGIYTEGRFFALIHQDTLYLKVDDESRSAFEARGLAPFRPFRDPARAMRYYPLPGGLLEDAERLEPWIRGAVAAAKARPRSPG